jgi:hypothetical protein
MTRDRASTKATGGGGYTFADKVAAAFLAQMLKRAFPLEVDLGVVTQVHFETRDTGHVLDDLELILSRAVDATRCLVSVKSNRQLTKNGFNREFVQDAWDEWRGSAGSKFDGEKDILCLIVGVIEEATLHEWTELQKQAARTTPDRLSERLYSNGQSSKTQRAIFESLRQSASGEMDHIETARLVARLRLLRFSDAMEGDHLNLCAEIVRAGTLEDGARLWARLIQLASESRGTGAYFDLPKLVGVLRPDFNLQDHPDFRPAWNNLEAVSAENIRGVRVEIGNGIELARADERKRLELMVDSHKAVVIAGESGSGKSAMVSQLMRPSGAFKRTIWLTAEQLSRASQSELASAFNLGFTIPELIANSGGHGCVLIIDGLERFEGEARLRAVELLWAVREEGFVGWKVIMTCQPQSLDSAHDMLTDAGIDSAQKVDFEKPTLEEVLGAVKSVPGLKPLLVREELQPILRNLMVLDWVLKADVAQRLSPSEWVGVTDVIDCIWERWTGEGAKRLARDLLLRTLGEREGEKLSVAVHVDSIPSTELELLGQFAQEGLVRLSPPSVQFVHDLMGDWARYRILKFAGSDAPTKIRTLAQIPRWGRAIRLYAQSLAEHGRGLDDWSAAMIEFAGEDPGSRLASDLFLDGLLFASNAESLLQQVWPDLLANDSQILRRLLRRLVHVASFPDWRLTGLGDPKLAEHFEAWFRIPQPIFWIPVLRLLSRHAADVAAHALMQGAEACALWLRTMPVGLPGRHEAGLLALALAREAQALIAAETVHFRDKDKSIHEALLSAAPEFPNEVAQIARELCGRKNEPAHAVQRRRDEQERQKRQQEEWEKKNPERKWEIHHPVFEQGSYRDSPMRPPSPDGPLRAVQEGFQSAVMGTAALSGLMSVRPEVAREVLLAVCLEEPKALDPYGGQPLRQDLGLADWREGYPAMYWKGPFLRFLQQAPKEGLDAIVRLVNHATERWLEEGLRRKPNEEDRKRYGFEFDLHGKSVGWAGDANMFAWHRQFTMGADVIETALMALEKWFYDEIEKGTNVTDWIQYVLDHSQSAAFAGVLVSVGLKYPALFAGQLQPLFGNYYIYHCQASVAQSELGETWRIPLSRQPQAVIEVAEEWNRMPHRRQLLWDVATGIMLQHKGTLDFLIARRAEWAKIPEEDQKERIRKEFFLARFDPANYIETPHGDGQVLITMRWPPHLEKIAKDSENDGRLRMISLTLALSARQLLDGQKTLSEEHLAEFATQIQQLANWKDMSEGGAHDDYRVNSIAGGLAVLVIEHREWLSRNPEIVKWCLATLSDLKPVIPEHYSPVSVDDHSAEIFLGETGVALLKESGEDWVLRLAFEGVTGMQYNATFFTLWRAYLLREQLGEKFGELINVAVVWSALRRAAIRECGYYADAGTLARYKSALFRRFVAGRLKGPLIPFERVEILGRRLVERIDRRSMSRAERQQREELRRSARERRDGHKLYREMPNIDLEVVQKAFGFLFAMLRDPQRPDEALLEGYVRELFNLLIRTLPRPDPDDERAEIEGTPYGPDRWIMERVAEFVACRSSVGTARNYYRPILELGPAAKYWVEDFLESWMSHALPVSTDLAGFAKIWQDMIAYVEILPAWQPGEGNYWCPAEGLAVNLMGLNEAAIAVLGDAKYRGLVSSMAPTFERWGARWLKYGSAAGWLAYFLRTESGQVLLTQSVKQLSVVVGSLPSREWEHHELGPLFTEALSLCWKTRRKEVEKDPSLHEAFLHLLADLCARQIPEALHLRSKVSEALASS